MNVSVEFDKRGVKQRIERKTGEVQVALDVQVAKDSNFFCPDADGTLKSSVMRSDFGSGVIEWDTVYAREQYYGLPNKSTDKNPNAMMMWFEEAKSRFKKDWERLANDAYNR